MVMIARRSTVDYLSGAEELRRQELVWGFVREPPAPFYGHQSIITRTIVLLDQHVRSGGLGRVCVSPIDVVLDAQKALVLQPDVIFVSNANAAIVRDQIWGAPDLVIEVESSGTRRRDRTLKLRWYRKYGVREYWLIDPRGAVITIMALNDGVRVRRQRFRGSQVVRSAVLGELPVPASAFFE
jgi:Uma2 family endonuclease